MAKRMANPWKTLSSKIVLENPWWKIRVDEVIRPDGSRGEYNVVSNNNASMVVALTENNELILIKLYRYITGKLSLEIPGGGIDNDETPLSCAKREFEEETGITASKWTSLGAVCPLNGLCDEETYYFIARQLDRSREIIQTDEAVQAIVTVPFRDVIKMIKSGDLTDGQSIAAIFLAGLHLDLL